MIESRDIEYLEDGDYSVALGRVFDSDRWTSAHLNNPTADKIYPFSNENVTDSLRKFDLQGKRVATVGSSGDQVLNAILKGASHITFIDGNPMARYYIELKMASIKNLSMEENLKYFTAQNILYPYYYAKVSHDLSDEAKLFWDHIILEAGGVASKILIKNLFHDCFSDNQMANSYYRDENEYNKLQSLIPSVDMEYIICEFNDFPKKLKGKYDLIMLSNIADYVPIDGFTRIAGMLYDNNLNQYGNMQVYYNFSCDRIKYMDFKKLKSRCLDYKFKRIFVIGSDQFMNVNGNCILIESHKVNPNYASCEFIEKG